MKFKIGQPVWALFSKEHRDLDGDVDVVSYGRFAGVITGPGLQRKTWRMLWRRYDWTVTFADSPNGPLWDFCEDLLEPRDPDQFLGAKWADCLWAPSRSKETAQ